MSELNPAVILRDRSGGKKNVMKVLSNAERQWKRINRPVCASVKFNVNSRYIGYRKIKQFCPIARYKFLTRRLFQIELPFREKTYYIARRRNAGRFRSRLSTRARAQRSTIPTFFLTNPKRSSLVDQSTEIEKRRFIILAIKIRPRIINLNVIFLTESEYPN